MENSKFETCVSGWLRLQPFPSPYPSPYPNFGMRRLKAKQLHGSQLEILPEKPCGIGNGYGNGDGDESPVSLIQTNRYDSKSKIQLRGWVGIPNS